MRWLPLVLAVTAGCSGAKVTATGAAGDAGPPPAPPCCCVQDSTLACGGDSFGVTCPRGAAPESSFGAGLPLSCSDPAPGADSDGYCCVEAYGGDACWSDLLVAGCAYPSLGFSCAGSDPATQVDPSLVCEAGAPDPASGHTPYCCHAAGSSGRGTSCVADPSVPGCDFPSVGLSCAGTDTPTDADPSLACTAGAPDPNTGNALYCCQ